MVREKQGFEETIAKMELQIEVSKGNEDRFAEQLQEREQIIERLQAEIVSLRSQTEKGNIS